MRMPRPRIIKEVKLSKRIVGCSVWIIQDKNTLINYGLFSTKKKAKKFINGNDNMTMRKVWVM